MKNKKKFRIIAGCVLLVVAVLLFFQRSDYAKNKIAMLFGVEDYYVYVEQKNIEASNSSLTEKYDYLRELYKEIGSLHTTQQISISAQAEGLLKAFLKADEEAMAEASIYSIRQGDASGLVGEAHYQGESIPIELVYGAENAWLRHPLTGEYYSMTLGNTSFSMEQLLENSNIKSKKINKKLKEYEKLFFTALAESDIQLKEAVVQNVNAHLATQNELIVTSTREQLMAAFDAIFAAASEDEMLKELYTAGAKTADTYEVWLHQLRENCLGEQGFLAAVNSTEMKLHVNTNGIVTGRDIVLHTEDGEYRLGYMAVRNGLSIGFEAYVCIDGTEYFLADGVCKVEESVVNGDITVSVLAGEKTTEFQISLRDFAVMDLLQKRCMGGIKITSDLFSDVSIQIELQATKSRQECLLFLVYGGAIQLELDAVMEEAPLQELPKLPDNSKPISFSKNLETLYFI